MALGIWAAVATNVDGLPLDVEKVGIVGLCVIAVVAFIRGWIVTSREHDQALAAIAKKDEQIAEQARQLGHLEQVGRTVEQLARGLQQQMDERR